MKNEHELRRRLKQVNADIELDLKRLRDFDGKNMIREEGLALNRAAQRLVADTVAHYWLMSVLEEER